MNKPYLGALALAAFLAPYAASAAEYAYVNQMGEVMTVEAATAADAMIAAPGIDENSGVLLLDSSADEAVVGDEVAGV